MKQYQAGFILDNLFELFPRGTVQRDQVQALCNWLSHFQVQTNREWLNDQPESPAAIAVMVNLIQRGLPTRMPLAALSAIVERSSLLEWDNSDFAICIKWKYDEDEPVREKVFQSLHIIDPRINSADIETDYHKSWEHLGSQYEEDFIYSSLPATFSETEKTNANFLSQLLCTQRSITSIVKGVIPENKLSQKIRTNFDEQRTDFTIEFPYTDQDHEPKGLVIEVDGSQHQDPEQLYLDTERDRAVGAAGWGNTVRIKTSEFGSSAFQNKVSRLIAPALRNTFVAATEQNYLAPIWSTALGKEVAQLTLMPFAIARFQRVLLEAIIQGRLLLAADIWNIAVIEHDVPFAQLALHDLRELLDHYNELTTEPLVLPLINLAVFSSAEFIDSPFHLAPAEVKPVAEFSHEVQYDVLIDGSVLLRPGLVAAPVSRSRETIIFRSCHYRDASRKVVTAPLIKYQPFCEKTLDDKWIEDKDKKQHLEYFLQSVFRKKELRPGQLPIMHKALQCRSVIGLLPTGGGKSLTYQLSSLLQPGVCMVIDPIRSLMKDQVDGLNRNLIDSCVYINSTLQGEQKRKAMRKMAAGEAQFVFVSPERLQMEEFRAMFAQMEQERTYFSYCVIDEAHCVSEWGHDFRTAYLRLGENAMRFCKTANLPSVPLFGLTATASFDVLADVQRELSGNDEIRRLDEDAIVRSEFSKRPELQFVVEDVTIPDTGFKDIWDLKKSLGGAKQTRTKELLSRIPKKLHKLMQEPLSVFDKADWDKTEEEEGKLSPKQLFGQMQIPDFQPTAFFQDNNSALVFCPHRGWLFGVADKFKDPPGNSGYYDILKDMPGVKAGLFMGSGDDQDGIGKAIMEESIDCQSKFINGDLNLMVATKAFGMGIDKENIRYTIHVNYPGSIESYVQEAGRAGRDRKMAVSYILFSDQKVEIDGEKVDNDLDINLYFHQNSFKGTAKESAVLDELLTEIYFPDRTFELENLISHQLDLDVKLKYWEKESAKLLFVNKSFTEPLGFIDLVTLVGVNGKSVNHELSQKIFDVLIDYIKSLNLTEPVHHWLQKADKQVGIEKLLGSKAEGQAFSLVVGFSNNVTERVKTLTKWLQGVIHRNFTEDKVKQLRANCTDANAFVEQVCEQYQKFAGKPLDFEAACLNRDRSKGLPDGTTLVKFEAYYNGYRDKMDTEKAIYRLSTLGIIDDYTVNFAAGIFTLFGRKKTHQEYRDNLRRYLLKYYSEKSTNVKLEKLNLIQADTPLRGLLDFLIDFVYDEIQKKRERAIYDMRSACREALDKGEEGSKHLKEFIDLYFNSKYARKGYSFENEQAEDELASLADRTDEGKVDSMEEVWYFLEVIDRDKSSSQIDNTKHLRGACTRMLRSQPDSYTLQLLAAFALYMLEYKNPRFLQDAENLMVAAFASMQEKEPDWTDEHVEHLFEKFTSTVLNKNIELDATMARLGFRFDLETILIGRLLKPLRLATGTLKELNQKLTTLSY